MKHTSKVLLLTFILHVEHVRLKIAEIATVLEARIDSYCVRMCDLQPLQLRSRFAGHEINSNANDNSNANKLKSQTLL